MQILARRALIVLIVAPACLLALHSLPPASPKTAPPLTRDVPPAQPLPEKSPRKGPDQERWFFSDWHEPYGAVLDSEFQRRMDAAVAAMPTEEDLRGPDGRSVGAWELVGPSGMTTTSTAVWSGRVRDLEVENGATTRVASASGGLWGYFLFWPDALSDDVPNLAIGSVATDPSDPNHIVIGTGEPLVRNGSGAYETRDGGFSWTHLEMSAQPLGFYRIRFDPSNPSIVHAASTYAYRRSADGGTTWTAPLSGGGVITDLAICESSPNTVYAAMAHTGIWKSVNSGSNWTLLGDANGHLPTSGFDEIAITVCATNPNVLYASYIDAATSGTLGVYRSYNGGTAWTEVTPPANIHGEQGWYNNVISVSPTDWYTVLVGGISLWRTTNGGALWTMSTDPNVHADQHAIAWSADGQRVWLGNDGGWVFSTNEGASWQIPPAQLPITQFYHLDVGLGDPRVIGGGTQDNGITLTTEGGPNWRQAVAGDGGGFLVHPTNANCLWATNGVYPDTLYSFYRLRSTNSGNSWQAINNGIAPAWEWFPMIRHDRYANPYLYTYADYHVYRSVNQGTSWTDLNPSAFGALVNSIAVPKWDGTTLVWTGLESSAAGNRLWLYQGSSWQERSTGLPGGQRVRRVAVHPTDSQRAWALINGLGNDGQKVYQTTNRGVTWTNVTGNLPNVAVSDLVAHPTNPNLLYLGSERGLYRTTTGGSSWHRWNDGLPDATIVTELSTIDSLGTSGEYWVVAATFGRSIWKREISTDDVAAVGEGARDVVGFQLAPARPNPANVSTAIDFVLPKSGKCELRIFDVLGREVATLVNGVLAAGRHSRSLDASGLAPGAYFCRLKAGDRVRSQKLLIVR